MRKNLDPEARKNRRAKQRKIRTKLKRLRKIRERIAELQATQPARYRGRVKHWQKVAGQLRRQLRKLGWKPGKKRSSDPFEETEAQTQDEYLEEPSGTADPEESDIPEEEEPEDGGEDGGNAATEGDDTGCSCNHPNWIHGDGENPKFFAKVGTALKRLKEGVWRPPQTLGTQGKLLTRPGQRAMIIDVAPGLHIVQFVPAELVPAKEGTGDDVGILPLLLLPGIAKAVRRKVEKVPDPQPGQPGNAATPPIAPPGSPDGAGGPRGRRRRPRPAGTRPRCKPEEPAEDDAGRCVPRRRPPGGGAR